jgi:hypothetical protein
MVLGMNKDRWLATAVALLTAALIGTAIVCVSARSKDSPTTTSRSVWWAPVVAWNDPSLDNKIFKLLADKGIEFIFVGSRGMRIRVPYERHQEATNILRGAAIAEHLKIHAVLVGPRTGAVLPMLGPESGDAGWTELMSFTLSELPAARLQEVLNGKGIECGVVSFSWDPKSAHLFVPPGADAMARSALKEASIEGDIKSK